MKVLALDLSFSTGWALFEQQKDWEEPTLRMWGVVTLDQKLKDYGEYPWNYLHACQALARKILALATMHSPDIVVIEETNGSKSRYTQKVLEFIHAAVLDEFWGLTWPPRPTVVYINTGDWRRGLGIIMGKEDKKLNAKLSRAKRRAQETGEKLDKKALGIRGKINKKHLALRFVNAKYPEMGLKVKDDDIADAICLGLAFFHGVPHCDGEK